MKNTAHIRAQIAAAIADGTREIVLRGDYTVEETILLPSDFTVILENAHLTMAEGTFCNMFRNEHAGTEVGRTAAGTDRNIRILGRGRAILDGGVYNGLSEKNENQDGRPPIHVNSLVLFGNVEGLAVEHIQCRNQRWWALNFIACGNGRLRNIDFCADDRQIRPDGTVVHGLTQDNRAGIYVNNADGIDLRVGCHDFLIENITGFTEDDTVALTGLLGNLQTTFGRADGNTAIRNVIIRNVQSASFCSNVRLLNQSGVRMYNILVDGVMDTSADSPHLDRGVFGVRVGDHRLYGTRQPRPDECARIAVRNVYSRGMTAAVCLSGPKTDVTVENVYPFDECPCAVQDLRE